MYIESNSHVTISGNLTVTGQINNQIQRNNLNTNNLLVYNDASFLSLVDTSSLLVHNDIICSGNITASQNITVSEDLIASGTIQGQDISANANIRATGNINLYSSYSNIIFSNTDTNGVKLKLFGSSNYDIGINGGSMFFRSTGHDGFNFYHGGSDIQTETTSSSVTKPLNIKRDGIDVSKNITFPANGGNKLNLYGDHYNIGIAPYTMVFRVPDSLSFFKFYIGGNEGDTETASGVFKPLEINSNGINVSETITGGNLILGGNNQTPMIDMMYIDHGAGASYDKRITIGEVNDFPNTTGLPATPPSNSMGINIQNNSDGFFIGIEQIEQLPVTVGNYRPLLKWGDDSTDTPFTIKYQGADNNTCQWEFKTDGRLVVPNVVKGASGTVCKIHILPFSDHETTNSFDSTSWQSIINKTFIKTEGTNLFGEININYTINGHNGELYQARLMLRLTGGGLLGVSFTTGESYDIKYNGAGGGGNRSGDINSAAVYTNGYHTSLSGNANIYLETIRINGDDQISFKGGFFKVTEIWA